MLVADAAAVHEAHLRESSEMIGADVLARLRQGERIPGPVYAAARRTQSEWRRKLARVFEDVTLLATPTTPVAAGEIRAAESVEMARVLTSLTAPFNLTGVPAISVPCGLTGDGLPVGLQLAAPWWREGRLLRAARAYESATEWHALRPPPLN
jgi:aspartyl-tRNA(Asn)/glutamyl-tRNA(Gln) amidotransferase subunit A